MLTETRWGYYDYTDRHEPDIPADAGQGFDTLLVWTPFVNEAAKLVENDVVTAAEIDTGARLGGNWPEGPLDKCDEGGANVILRKLTEVATRHDRRTNSPKGSTVTCWVRR
ncbi:3-hydroxyacyl-CoA dehydrogenase, C-terminal domain [Halorientalis persicus]|uniref:3-hydroxyacyl-CoA dehydrogenase, C-terminal domain n=1 Tax=Halorientalis persicus TaxID=1367881 RepID=A0A1H8U4C9_9EURY|nr:3-hydroxyacyl-CoA dehydrogenase family protein [Halorientalis persicus]SEO97927.1 3-hydroxyacyl-CoA dehydrogenase, C-terminal domain [Halorientalis persicus]